MITKKQVKELQDLYNEISEEFDASDTAIIASSAIMQTVAMHYPRNLIKNIKEQRAIMLNRETL